ncbi:hypothetical protein NO2_1042 [Candidatus Termititenax persephonae]|uniref:Uncharacterized protein n=1 Tax=Candidatus Termititenax persephonae TaxID=2218525 RepID=A0A388TI96_9BACT|nr:hypothetical protein NO2_1042 [Candidatus Termititenax persephonae]
MQIFLNKLVSSAEKQNVFLNTVDKLQISKHNMKSPVKDAAGFSTFTLRGHLSCRLPLVGEVILRRLKCDPLDYPLEFGFLAARLNLQNQGNILPISANSLGYLRHNRAYVLGLESPLAIQFTDSPARADAVYATFDGQARGVMLSNDFKKFYVEDLGEVAVTSVYLSFAANYFTLTLDNDLPFELPFLQNLRAGGVRLDNTRKIIAYTFREPLVRPAKDFGLAANYNLYITEIGLVDARHYSCLLLPTRYCSAQLMILNSQGQVRILK